MSKKRKMPLKEVMKERNRIKAIQAFHKYMGCVAAMIGATKYTVDGVTIWDYSDSEKKE